MSSRFVSRTCSILALGAFAGLLASCSSDTKTGARSRLGAAVPAARRAPQAGAAGKACAGGAGGSGRRGGGGGVLNAQQARGKYLVVAVIACGDCHTPQGRPAAPISPSTSPAIRPSSSCRTATSWASRNLTNDATGFTNRSDAEIKTMFLGGKRPSGTRTEAFNPVSRTTCSTT